ncbi:MAG: patatin-like phospholipase family protein [Elusimicrobiota bacterium]
MTPEEIEAWNPFLKRIPLFKDLSAEDRRQVAGLLKPLSLPRGAILFQQGDAGDAFFIITSGHVQLVTERPEGKRVAGYLGRGDTLGELALLTGEPRAWTVLLESTTEFLVLSKSDFATVLRENPSILLQLSRTLSTRLLQETRSGGQSRQLQPRILALLASLDDGARTLFANYFGLSLAEQSRRRVLLVDMDPKAGALAKAFGLKPLVVTEEMLRGRDLRDPKLLEKYVQVHASSLGVVTLPSSVLAGRLYRSVFLLMNLLRDHSDFVILAMRAPLDDVEKAVLYEADQWMLVGGEGRKDEFLRLRLELSGYVPEPRRLLEVWLGDRAPAELRYSSGREWTRVTWPPGLVESFVKQGASPFQAMNLFPRARGGVEGLVRRFARLRVGLALGTGAALGYALVGIMKSFEREHIPVDFIAGTSIGSLMGGWLALGLTPAEIEKICVGVDKAWVWENLFWDLTVPRSGIFAGTTLLRFIRSYFGDKEFHELEIPFRCVATDIETGEEVVFKEGNVAQAIRASCGIPLVFQPLPYQGRFLVDGGLVDPVPIKVVSQMGADILISVNLTMPAGERKSALSKRRGVGASLMNLDLKQLKGLTLPTALQAPNMFQIFFQMIYTMEYEIAKSRSALAHVNIHPDLTGFSWTEMHRGKEIVEAGERIAEAVLPKIKAMLPYFSDSCKVGIHPAPWGVR